MHDRTVERKYEDVTYDAARLNEYVARVLRLEAVACKDWLTNKVDRSVGRGGPPAVSRRNSVAVERLRRGGFDYRGKAGIATAIGHAPQAGLADPAAGSVLSVAESLTNIVWAPLTDGLDSVSLSANWMWPCRSQEGEDARLYQGVQALSDFCCALEINVPTGKDSLSMSQQYPGGEKIISPGTVIVSAGGEVSDVKKVVSPVMVNKAKSTFYHIDFSFDDLRLGGSAFAQSLNKVGSDVPTCKNPEYFRDAFNAVQKLVNDGLVLAGHDISAGGLITTLLEMCFANTEGGMEVNVDKFGRHDIVKILLAENPGVVVQIADKDKHEFKKIMDEAGVGYVKLGHPTDERLIQVTKDGAEYQFGIDYLRDVWFSTSYLLDRKQSMNGCAKARFENYKEQPLEMVFNKDFSGKLSQYGLNPDRREPSGIKAAIIREKGNKRRARDGLFSLSGRLRREGRDDDRPHQRPRDVGRH